MTDFAHASTGKAKFFLSRPVPVILKSTCRIDMRWFPFDVQKCDLVFGSWSYGAWTLDLQKKEADISIYTPSGEWDLLGKKDRPLDGSLSKVRSFLSGLFFSARGQWESELQTVSMLRGDVS